LSLVAAPTSHNLRPEAESIERALANLKRALTRERKIILAGIGHRRVSAHPDEAYSAGYASVDQYIDGTMATLSESIDLSLSWLRDGDAANEFFKTVEPLAPIELLITDLLPAVYELAFGKKCGNGRDGPGTRFIVAVLREANLIPIITSDETASATIVKKRERASK
jgi:hypothetical protein